MARQSDLRLEVMQDNCVSQMCYVRSGPFFDVSGLRSPWELLHQRNPASEHLRPSSCASNPVDSRHRLRQPPTDWDFQHLPTLSLPTLSSLLSSTRGCPVIVVGGFKKSMEIYGNLKLKMLRSEGRRSKRFLEAALGLEDKGSPRPGMSLHCLKPFPSQISTHKQPEKSEKLGNDDEWCTRCACVQMTWVWFRRWTGSGFIQFVGSRWMWRGHTWMEKCLANRCNS